MSNDDNTPTGEGTVGEQTEQVTEQETVQDYTIEDLLGLTAEDYEEFQEEAQHKGMKPLHHWMEHLPEDVRKHIANIRSSYTKKTQEISQQRKELEQLKQDLLSQRQSVLDNSTIQHLESHITEEEFDPYSSDGMQKEIKRQAALMLKEMMQPAQQQMQVQIEMERRQLALEQFKMEHPDLTSQEMKLPIAQLLTERPELKLEDAYYIVKSKLEASKAKAAQEEFASRKQTNKQNFAKTSTGKSVSPSGTPKFRDAWEAFQWHKAQETKK